MFVYINIVKLCNIYSKDLTYRTWKFRKLKKKMSAYIVFGVLKVMKRSNFNMCTYLRSQVDIHVSGKIIKGDNPKHTMISSRYKLASDFLNFYF